MENEFTGTVHHGQNIKRLREILGVKQEAIAMKLNITQQAMSKLEQRAQIEDEVLGKISSILNIPVDSIKNYNDDATIHIISNTFNQVSFLGHAHTSQQIFNPVDRIVELYERLLKSEQEKNALLEKALSKS